MLLGHCAARPTGHPPAAACAQGQEGQWPREHQRGPVSAQEVLPPHPAAARPASSFSCLAAILQDSPALQRHRRQHVRPVAWGDHSGQRSNWGQLGMDTNSGVTTS